MRTLITIILLIAFALPAMAQRPNPEYLTNVDIQIRFVRGGLSSDSPWLDTDVVSISYAAGPIAATHKPTAAPGLQKWEFMLQNNMAIPERGIIQINVPVWKSNKMELRVRVRRVENNTVKASPWSPVGSIDLEVPELGPPALPILVE